MPATWACDSDIVLGKHSGRHALRSHLAEIGIHLEGPELDEVFRSFKATADKKKEVTTADLEALVGEEIRQREDVYSLEHVYTTAGTDIISSSQVGVSTQGKKRTGKAFTGGSIESIMLAIDDAVGVKGKLLDYQVRSITSGKDSLGEVRVVVEVDGKRYAGWRNLFELAADEARRRGARRLYISATPSQHTIDFYLSLGCTVTAEPDPELFALEPGDIHLEYDLTTSACEDYTLLDSGGGRKLERFGPVTLIRPEAQAAWQPALPAAAWDAAHAVFQPAGKEGGRWAVRHPLPPRWEMRCQSSALLGAGQRVAPGGRLPGERSPLAVDRRPGAASRPAAACP